MNNEVETYKLEGKESDVIRQFIYNDDIKKFEENKIVIDKLGNILNKKIVGQWNSIQYASYTFKLIQKGYLIRLAGVI